jgi:hypothetical protein
MECCFEKLMQYVENSRHIDLNYKINLDLYELFVGEDN